MFDSLRPFGETLPLQQPSMGQLLMPWRKHVRSAEEAARAMEKAAHLECMDSAVALHVGQSADCLTIICRVCCSPEDVASRILIDRTNISCGTQPIWKQQRNFGVFGIN